MLRRQPSATDAMNAAVVSRATAAIRMGRPLTGSVFDSRLDKAWVTEDGRAWVFYKGIAANVYMQTSEP